jgi:hypothetical protein
MRSVKTTGGMTRGKGMSEQQRAQWVLSMPACSSINLAMQKVENLHYETRVSLAKLLIDVRVIIF